jgi:U3 small nucleolar RNA-associated protein 19
MLSALNKTTQISEKHVDTLNKVVVEIVAILKLFIDPQIGFDHPKKEQLTVNYSVKYQAVIEKLLVISKRVSLPENVRGGALDLLCRLMPLQRDIYLIESFPVDYFRKILACVIGSEKNMILLNTLKAYMGYSDVASHMWHALAGICDEEGTLSKEQVHNILQVICLCKKLTIGTIQPQPYFFCTICEVDKKKLAFMVQRVWAKVSTGELSENTSQLLTVVLVDHMMFRMKNPVLVTDFLFAQLDVDSPASVIALQGILDLITYTNIEYPNIYFKLYSMFTYSVLNSPYRHRFYYLADKFLSSTYLQKSMIAGFIKRIIRLSLNACPDDILILLEFIKNLLIRHPSLRDMVLKMGRCNMNNDMYDMEEPDPSASGAINSSLWELQILRKHAIPTVSITAYSVSGPLSNIEAQITDLLQMDNMAKMMMKYKNVVARAPIMNDASGSRGKQDLTPNLWAV